MTDTEAPAPAPSDRVPNGEVTTAQLDHELAALCEAHPDYANPRGRSEFGLGMCEYRLANDEQPEQPCRSCLIGTWLLLRGEEYESDWEGDDASRVLRDLDYTLKVAQRAFRWQMIADGRGDNGDTREVTWGEALEEMRERFDAA